MFSGKDMDHKEDADFAETPEDLNGAEEAEAPEEAVETENPDEAEEAEGTIDSETGEEPEDQDEAGETEQPEDGEQADEADEKKGGIFSRREKKALAKKDEEIAALKDRYMRTLAEYENYRKRTEKEKSDLYSYAVKDVMTKILPVLDNLERGLAALPEEAKDDPVAEGMDKINKQFVKALDDIGVKPIEAAGQPFDPKYHNAVMHVEDEELGENVVAEELQKGYTYRDTVVRYSMVKVAN